MSLATFKQTIHSGDYDGVPGPRWDGVNTPNLGIALRRVIEDDEKLEPVADLVRVHSLLSIHPEQR